MKTATITLAGQPATIAAPRLEDLAWIGQHILEPNADEAVRAFMAPLDPADRLKAVARALLIVAQGEDPIPGDDGRRAVPTARAMLAALSAALVAANPGWTAGQAEARLHAASAFELVGTLPALAEMLDAWIVDLTAALEQARRAYGAIKAPMMAEATASRAPGSPTDAR